MGQSAPTLGARVHVWFRVRQSTVVTLLYVGHIPSFRIGPPTHSTPSTHMCVGLQKSLYM